MDPTLVASDWRRRNRRTFQQVQTAAATSEQLKPCDTEAVQVAALRIALDALIFFDVKQATVDQLIAVVNAAIDGAGLAAEAVAKQLAKAKEMQGFD
jgi:hypothetical protein